MSEQESRLARMEERLAWFERHVTDQDKVILELSDLVERLRREVLVLRERAAMSGSAGGPASPADERPPHY